MALAERLDALPTWGRSPWKRAKVTSRTRNGASGPRRCEMELLLPPESRLGLQLGSGQGACLCPSTVSCLSRCRSMSPSIPRAFENLLQFVLSRVLARMVPQKDALKPVIVESHWFSHPLSRWSKSVQSSQLAPCSTPVLCGRCVKGVGAEETEGGDEKWLRGLFKENERRNCAAHLCSWRHLGKRPYSGTPPRNISLEKAN
jgi:hypothetical protein